MFISFRPLFNFRNYFHFIARVYIFYHSSLISLDDFLMCLLYIRRFQSILVFLVYESCNFLAFSLGRSTCHILPHLLLFYNLSLLILKVYNNIAPFWNIYLIFFAIICVHLKFFQFILNFLESIK